MITLACDMDGVFCDWDQGLIDAWTADPVQKHKPYIEKHNRTTFYADDQYTDPEDIKFIELAPRRPGFYENLLPLEGSVEGVKELEKMGFDIIICTAPMTDHPTCAQEKLAWIKKHLGLDWVNRTYIAKDKTRIRANFLIDGELLTV